MRTLYDEIEVAPAEGGWDDARDTWISTRVRSELVLDPDIRSGNYTIDTENGWVYLIGSARSHEAMRDLVRLRAQATRDLRKTRQQLLSFLLRHGLVSPYGHWTKMHRRWLGELIFAHPAQHLAHEEMLQRIEGPRRCATG